MSEPAIRIFPNLDGLSHAVAARFAELTRQRAREGKNFSVALSGGETPQALYGLLAGKEFSVPWERVHLFQVDERCVPPDHQESNYGMIREALLSRVPAAAPNFHRMEAESSDLEKAARDYQEVVARELASPKDQWARFDLILLGMGPDGHTASLFPGTPALSEKSRWVTPNFVAKLGTHRLTLTYPVLNAAVEVIFMVSGARKAGTLREVLEGPPRPEQFPSQAVRPEDGRLEWYVDAAAASLLKQAAGRSA